MSRRLMNVVFGLSVIIPLLSFSVHSTAMSPKNLTKVSWAHAVNNQSLLDSALKGPIEMLEADIVLGKLITDNGTALYPIMGHPPAVTSDLSLVQFLRIVSDFNENEINPTKGIKLDFKSIEVFEQSIDLIVPALESSFPVWINADILPGPINSTVKPVDATRFLRACQSSNFKKTVLSLGWTTAYGEFSENGKYNDQQIIDMLTTIDKSGVTNEITFAVRAGLAAESISNMLKLIGTCPNSTLTIWSSQGDPVNVQRLRKLIFQSGLDHVYVDVPQSLRDQLHLDEL